MTAIKDHPMLIVLWLFIFGMVASPAFAQVEPQSNRPKTYILTGKVLNEKTGEVISKVKVTITDSDKSTTTDKEGAFSFSQLPSGQYTVKIKAPGYKTWKKKLSISKDSDLTIGLEPGK